MNTVRRLSGPWACLVIAGLTLAVGCGTTPDSPTRKTVRVSGIEWPRWGGPAGDFKLADAGLADAWPETGPTRIWDRELGGGYSAVTAAGGALFTMFRDGDDDVAVALSAESGESIWEHRYTAKTREKNVTQFGAGPNATPLVVGDRLITLGYTGILKALAIEGGEPIWEHDLITAFDGEVLDFGYSASPILHDGSVIVLVGGEKHAVLALNPTDGSVVWSSRPGTVSYATPIVIDVDGRTQIVYMSADEVIGIDAADGTFLWSHPCVNQYNNNATDPIWGEDNLLWVATQLDGGTRVLRLTDDGGRTAVEEIWYSERVKIHYWNALRVGDHVYASIGTRGSMKLAAIEIQTGKIVWQQRGFGQANLLQAGDKTILLDGGGQLALLELTPEGMEIRSQAQVVNDVTWTPPTLIGTRLYVRDKTRLRAFDLAR